MEEKELLSAIEDMMAHCVQNREKIRNNVDRIQKENVFERLEK